MCRERPRPARSTKQYAELAVFAAVYPEFVACDKASGRPSRGNWAEAIRSLRPTAKSSHWPETPYALALLP